MNIESLRPNQETTPPQDIDHARGIMERGIQRVIHDSLQPLDALPEKTFSNSRIIGITSEPDVRFYEFIEGSEDPRIIQIPAEDARTAAYAVMEEFGLATQIVLAQNETKRNGGVQETTVYPSTQHKIIFLQRRETDGNGEVALETWYAIDPRRTHGNENRKLRQLHDQK